MLVAELQKTKNIARQMKSTDLATPVVEDFVGADAAADDPVSVVAGSFSPKISAFRRYETGVPKLRVWLSGAKALRIEIGRRNVSVSITGDGAWLIISESASS